MLETVKIFTHARMHNKIGGRGLPRIINVVMTHQHALRVSYIATVDTPQFKQIQVRSPSRYSTSVVFVYI